MSEAEVDTIELPLNQRFSQARKAKNLTLDEVSEHLNLRLPQLNKLENESIDFVTMSPFERGYVRNYAQFLGIDMSVYETNVSENASVGAELKSMNRYKYPAPLPFFKKGWVKFFIFFLTVSIVASLLVMNFDFNLA